MTFKFQYNSKFALLAVNDVYVEIPTTDFQLSDGTWVMPRVPVSDLGIWKEWIGSLRTDQLTKANLVIFIEEESDNPEILDAVHKGFGEDLSRLFYFMHLRDGIECDGADLLCGSSEHGVPHIRHMSKLPKFFQSKGYRRSPVTKAWLEEAIALRSAVAAIESDKGDFRRVIRGLNTLLKGLKETGQDRLHQFVRSLEALIMPELGKTQRQFVHRCQTFAHAGNDTRSILREAFDMRSDTEHLNEWDRAVQNYPVGQREDVCWQRTRQVEHLSCFAYSHILLDAALRNHFRTDATITSFWNLPDDKRRLLWGTQLHLALEPLIVEYDSWGRTPMNGSEAGA